MLCIVVPISAFFIIWLMGLLLRKVCIIATVLKRQDDHGQKGFHLPLYYHVGGDIGDHSNIRIPSSSPRLQTHNNNQQGPQPSTSIMTTRNYYTPPPLPRNPPCFNPNTHNTQQTNGSVMRINGSHDSVNSLYGQL